MVLLHIDPRHRLVLLPGLLRLTSIAAVAISKTSRYLRAVMQELGFLQPSPTPLYVDNKSALQIINARRPTDRSRHIDIQALISRIGKTMVTFYFIIFLESLIHLIH
jgi:hypothetical protein